MTRRTVLALVLFIGFAASAFALDFGATLDNASSYGNAQTPAFTQQDTLSGWFTVGAPDALSFNVSGFAELSNGSPLYLIDLNTLNLTGHVAKIPNGPALFNYVLGRFDVSDFTGLVYSQKLDGAQLDFNYPGFSVTTTIGYTGFVLKPSSNIVLTKADSSALTAAAPAANAPFIDQLESYFGSPRAIGMVNVLFPGLLLQQDLNVAAMFQEDLRPLFAGDLIQPGTTTFSSSQGGTLDSQYFGAGLGGPLAAALYYNTFFFLETGRTLSYINGSYQYTPILAYLGGAGARYYLPQLFGAMVGLDLSYASGDSDFTTAIEGNSAGSANAFTPVTNLPQELALVFSPALENLITGTLTLSAKPLSGIAADSLANIQTVVKAIPFLRATTGPVTAAGLSASSTDLYLGTEFDFIVNYRPFSDLGLDLQGGMFLPNASAFVGSAQQMQFLGKLDFSFSF